jgi:phage baseplate assembly protein W
MAKEQKYGIKFPINVSSEDMTLFDLSQSRAEQVKSEVMHLIFTPKGQRLRNPNFGTRLIQYIFNPNDTETWGDIVSEIKETVKMWIPDCKIKEVEVAEFEEGLTLYARIRYTLTESDGSDGNYEIISKL